MVTREEIVAKLGSEAVEELCRRWKIRGLALFGSMLRDDFDRESDVDILVTFDPTADWGLLDHALMQEELSAIVGREVDLVSRRAVESSANWIRREAILGTAETVYAAA